MKAWMLITLLLAAGCGKRADDVPAEPQPPAKRCSAPGYCMSCGLTMGFKFSCGPAFRFDCPQPCKD